jgi:hypothetical protein
MSWQRATFSPQPASKKMTPSAGATVVGVGATEGVGLGRVGVAGAGVVARAVGREALEVGADTVDVGAATPEQAAIVKAATSVVASGRRISFHPVR